MQAASDIRSAIDCNVLERGSQQRAVEQRVDVVILGDQDGEAVRRRRDVTIGGFAVAIARNPSAAANDTMARPHSKNDVTRPLIRRS